MPGGFVVFENSIQASIGFPVRERINSCDNLSPTLLKQMVLSAAATLSLAEIAFGTNPFKISDIREGETEG